MRSLVGIDPSLTSTGFAIITQTPADVHSPGRTFLTVSSFKPAKVEGTGPVAEAARVASIVDNICTSCARAEKVLLEGLAMNSRTGKYAERAHLFYALTAAFVARRKSVSSLPPTSLKKAITGNGRADKEQVLDAVRAAWSGRGWEDGLKSGRYDRADAAALAWILAAHEGWDVPEFAG